MKPLMILILLAASAAVVVAAPKRFRQEVTFEGAFLPVAEASVPPVLKKTVRPEYPFDLRRSGQQGGAVVTFLVDEEGRPEQVQCSEATDKAFAKAAVACVKQWRYQPAQRDGQPVRVRLEQTITFSLNGAR